MQVQIPNQSKKNIKTSLILSNTAIKNLITKSLIPEFDLVKKEISELHQRIDDLEQNSRKNCLKFSGISEPAQGKEDTDQIFLGVINKYILVGSSQQNMHRIAISNSHRLDPRPRPGTRDPPKDIIVKFVRFRDRALVNSNKRNLKSYNQNPSNSYKIFVNEALTTKRAKLRTCRMDQLIQSCWTYKGNLFVKNPLCQQWKKRQRKCCTYNLNNKKL